MIIKNIGIILLIVLLCGCQRNLDNEQHNYDNNNWSNEVEQSEVIEDVIEHEAVLHEDTSYSLMNEEGSTIQERILTPPNFTRVDQEPSSFGDYLRNLPLKPSGSQVFYFDGRLKSNTNAYCAVVDMDIGDRNLLQCADAVMLLRAEYLYGEERYDAIHFNFTNGFRVDYSQWMEGYRVKIEGNKTSWKKVTDADNSYTTFRKYMDIIFAYAGTLSLSKELKATDIEDMRIGDVFIQGGTPGHTVIIVDMALNEETGDKLFLLAQSYMPAQDIQILNNPMNDQISPWYQFENSDELRTPEWTFEWSDLMRFDEN